MMSDFNLEHLISVMSRNTQRLRKELKYDEFCNNTILRMYNYLEARQLKSGSIYDDNAKSVLNFQYHTAYYVLSSLLLYYLTTDGRYLENARLSLRHLVKLGYDVNRRANSFIGIALGLSFLFCENTGIRDEIVSYIEKVVFYPEIHQPKKSANNFYALKSLALLLRYRFLRKKKDENEGKEIIQSHLVNWQYPDGFFYDSPFEKNVKDGIPHLTYHATMTMVVIFCSILLEDQALFTKGEKALSALRAVTSPNGEAFSYGRSNNALFGFSNAILACSLMAFCDPKEKANINLYRFKLLDFVLRHQAEDGHLYIVPNPHENTRCGFDRYMFITVYETYGLAMLLLSHLIVSFNKGQNTNNRVKSPEYFIGQDSGFVSYKSECLSMGMNVVGHQRNISDYYNIDPRLTGGAPFWMCYGTEDVLPAIPYTYGSMISKPSSKIPLGITLGEFMNDMIQWHRNLPFSAGFLPYLKDKNSIRIFLGACKWKTCKWRENELKINMQGPLWLVSRKSSDIACFSVQRLLKAWFNRPLQSNLPKLFVRTDVYMCRNVLLSRDYIYFRDSISEYNSKKFDFVPFSLRTYDATTVESNNKYFVLRNSAKKHVMIVSRNEGEIIELRAKLGSSKGIVCSWNIVRGGKNKNDKENTITTDRLIMFREESNEKEKQKFSKEIERCFDEARSSFN